MKQNYDFILKEVLKSEGGYSNDPSDPGGPTNFGITIHDYRAYINASGTADDVRNMSLEQAETIYKSKYWNKVNGDELPSGVDYCVFDYAVNSGVSRANRIYHTYANASNPIDAICNERLRFLKGLRTWRLFGRGWSTRVDHVRVLSHRLYSNALAKPVPQPEVKQWPTTPTQNWLQRLVLSLTTYWSLLSSRVSHTS